MKSEAIQKTSQPIKDQIRESLWAASDDFFEELMNEIHVSFSAYSTAGGMAVRIRPCQDAEDEREISFIEILEECSEFDGFESSDGHLPELEVLAQGFDALAKKCRDRLANPPATR